jgi:hypothetical protein
MARRRSNNGTQPQADDQQDPQGTDNQDPQTAGQQDPQLQEEKQQTPVAPESPKAPEPPPTPPAAKSSGKIRLKANLKFDGTGIHPIGDIVEVGQPLRDELLASGAAEDVLE